MHLVIGYNELTDFIPSTADAGGNYIQGVLTKGVKIRVHTIDYWHQIFLQRST